MPVAGNDPFAFDPPDPGRVYRRTNSSARRSRSLLIAAVLACLSVSLPLSRVGKSMCFRQSLVTLWLALSLPLVAHALDRTQLAVVVNTLDPLSVQIGDYYAAKRRISFQNLIKVSFAPGQSDSEPEPIRGNKVAG